MAGQGSRRLLRAMNGEPEGADAADSTAEEVAIAKVIGDVWLASLVQWVTGRATAEDVDRSMDVAVRLLLRD